MVVSDDDGCGVAEDCSLETLAGMDHAGIQRSDVAGGDGVDLVFGVQADDEEILTIGILEKGLQELHSIPRRTNGPVRVQDGGLADHFQANDVNTLGWGLLTCEAT